MDNEVPPLGGIYHLWGRVGRSKRKRPELLKLRNFSERPGPPGGASSEDGPWDWDPMSAAGPVLCWPPAHSENKAFGIYRY